MNSSLLNKNIMTIYASSLFEGLGAKKKPVEKPAKKTPVKKTDEEKVKAAYKRAETLEKKKKKKEEELEAVSEEEIEEEIVETEEELEKAQALLEDKKEAQKLKRKQAAAERKKQKEIEEAVDAELEKPSKKVKIAEEEVEEEEDVKPKPKPKKRKIVQKTVEEAAPKWVAEFLQQFAIAKGKENGEKPNVKEIKDASKVVAQEKWDDPSIRKKLETEFKGTQNRLYAKMFPQ